MNELPLFPLHTVLFPGMPLQLHIFEERYKQMVKLCLEEAIPFGVVLIRSGLEALGPLAEPHLVGCTARIQHAEPVEGNRINLVVVGQERFRILNLKKDEQPYLVGEVEPFPFGQSDPLDVMQVGQHLHQVFERYLRGLNEAGVITFDLRNLPSSPLELAFVAATLLQAAPPHKQELLEIDELADLLRHLNRLYRRELALLSPMLAPQATSGEISFSKN